jgi:hypothetical protein
MVVLRFRGTDRIVIVAQAEANQRAHHSAGGAFGPQAVEDTVRGQGNYRVMQYVLYEHINTSPRQRLSRGEATAKFPSLLRESS